MGIVFICVLIYFMILKKKIINFILRFYGLLKFYSLWEKKMRRIIRFRWLKFGVVDEIKILNVMIV